MLYTRKSAAEHLKDGLLTFDATGHGLLMVSDSLGNYLIVAARAII